MSTQFALLHYDLVGEPTDEACRIEGIIFSIHEERRQHKNRMAYLKKLERSLQSSLRQFYIQEAQELEEKRAKAKADQLEREKNNSIVNTSVALSLLEEDDDDDDGLYRQDAYRRALITPPSSPAAAASANGADDHLVNPQAPPAYHYEMHPHLSSGAPRTNNSNGNGSSNKKINAQPKNMTWEEDMIQRGCDLFFCATIPLCVGPTASSAVNDVNGIADMGPPLQPSSSILTGTGTPSPHGSVQGRHHHQQQQHNYRQPNGHSYYYLNNQSPQHQQQYHDPSSLDEADNGSALSNASTSGSGAQHVDFSTGLSGHTGISQGGKRRQPIRKKEVRMMMSVHDGIAQFRRQQKKQQYSGAASVMSHSSKASITTL